MKIQPSFNQDEEHDKKTTIMEKTWGKCVKIVKGAYYKYTGLATMLLMEACYEGDIEMIKMLLAEGGTDPNNLDTSGRTALWIAVHGNYAYTDNSKAVIPSCDAVYQEQKKRKIEIIQLLLAAGANPNTVDKYGATVLKEASEMGYVEIIKILLAAGANPNILGSFGRTALMLSVCRYTGPGHIERKLETVKILLAAGANPNIVDEDGHSALQFVLSDACCGETRNKICIEIGKALLVAGANPNVGSGHLHTPLFYAVKYNHVDMVKALLQAGAKPEISPNQISQDFNKVTFLLQLPDEFNACKSAESLALVKAYQTKCNQGLKVLK